MAFYDPDTGNPDDVGTKIPPPVGGRGGTGIGPGGGFNAFAGIGGGFNGFGSPGGLGPTAFADAWRRRMMGQPMPMQQATQTAIGARQGAQPGVQLPTPIQPTTAPAPPMSGPSGFNGNPGQDWSQNPWWGKTGYGGNLNDFAGWGSNNNGTIAATYNLLNQFLNSGAFSPQGNQGLLDQVRAGAMRTANAQNQQAANNAALYGLDPAQAAYMKSQQAMQGNQGVMDAINNANLGFGMNQQQLGQSLLQSLLNFNQQYEGKGYDYEHQRLLNSQNQGQGGGLGGLLGGLVGTGLGAFTGGMGSGLAKRWFG